MRKFRRFFCLLILPILIASFCCPPPALALRVKQGSEAEEVVTALRAGMEEAAVAEGGLKLDWVRGIYPNDDGSERITDSARTVYFSFRLSPDSPALSKEEIRRALEAVSYGANYIPHLPAETQEVVRKEIEPFLKARAIVRNGESAVEIPLQRLRIVNVGKDATFRAGAMLGNEVTKLPEGSYSFQVDLSGDRENRWTTSSDHGVFRRAPIPQLPGIPLRKFTVAPPVLQPGEREELIRSVSERIEALSEARDSSSLVVLRADSLRDHPDLQELLDRLPPRLAGAAVVWEEAPGQPDIRVKANTLRMFVGNQVDLADYLARMPQSADGVAVVGDGDLVVFLKIFFRRAGIAVDLQPIGLEGFVLALGIPKSVLDQVGPATLSKELARLRSA